MAINNKKLMANYFYIVNKDGEAVLFNLRPEQDTVYKTIGEHVNAGEGCKIIILKARQLGISTFSVMLMLSNAISGKNQNSMMITHKQDISDELFSRILFAFNHLPKELKPDVAKNNSGELVFDNNKGTGLNNKIKIRTASENSTGLGRGETITGILHISEYPQWKLKDKGKELGSILNACSPRAVVIMEATARGYDDFKDRWDKAVSGENGWIPLFFPWFSDPKYVKPYWGFEFNEEELELKKRFNLSNEQLAFRRKVIMEDYNGDVNMFHQEYPSTPEEAFLSSGECIFDLNKINKRKYELTNKGNHFEDKGYFICEFDYDYENNEKKIRSYKWVSDHINGYIKMIQKPNPRYPYVLALDPSGVGDDFNGGHVLNNKTCEQVCTIHKQKLSSFDVACQLYCLGMEYNEALLATEINIAPEIINYLKEFGYTKLYISQTEGTNIANKLQMKYGFRTTTVTRPILISLLIEYINKETHLINDLDTLYEAENFVNITKEIDGVRKTKAQANVGKHDDLLMSLGIALYIRDSNQQTFELLPEKEINDFKPKTEFDRIFGNELFYEEDEGYMIYD